MSVSIPLCPVLHPTYEQFKNFEEYVNKIEEQYSGDYGMVKIVPPPQWVSRTNNYNKILKQLVFNQPEHQTLYSKQSDFAFQCENGKSHATFTLEDYKRAAEHKLKEISHISDLGQIQQYFWKSVKRINKQVYCANVETSLMDKTSGEWQFQHLESMFSRAVKEQLKGLNTSFLFIGAWKTFFNWHIEDLDLSAINILHQGAPKVWYGIHPQDRRLFESIIKDLFPEKTISCANFLRHKSIFVNPYKLKEKYPYLRVSRMHQLPNEISLAFSEGYHCGFNMGFNIAEAVNYGSYGWLDKLSKFKGCKCAEKVGIAIQSFQQVIRNLENSPNYQQIRNMPGYKKLVEKADQQRQEDEKFEKLPKEQVYKEFLKEKTKRINKGLKQVYVPKFKRYFPSSYCIEPQIDLSIQCGKCQKWRTVSSQIIQKYKGGSFFCKYIGKQCISRSRKGKILNKKGPKCR